VHFVGLYCIIVVQCAVQSNTKYKHTPKTSWELSADDIDWQQSGITFRTLRNPGQPTDHRSIISHKCDKVTLDIYNPTPISYIE
jgi:hypothetical protein